MKFDSTNKPIFFTCILGVFIYFVFYFVDAKVYPEYLYAIVPIRIAIVSWLAFCVFLLFRISEERLDLFAFLYLVPAGLAISLICYVIGEGFSSNYFMAILLIVMGSSMFARIKMVKYILLMLVIFAQHFFIQLLLPFQLKEVLISLLWMVSAFLLAIMTQNAIRRYDTALLRAKEELYLAATTDPLTNLLNRRKMIELIQRESIRTARSGRAYVVAIGDIDDFKQINDTYGHDEGDAVLVKVSDMMKKTLRTQDFVGRWGGEEFLIVLPETDMYGARLGMERIRKHIAGVPIKTSGGLINITMTFGLAASDQAKNIDSIIRLADDALYQGKHGTKNCVVVHHDPEPC